MLDDTLPGIGHNSPPLAELLPDETAALKARADELAAAAGRAAVTNEDTAGRATLLAKMMREHLKDIAAARAARKAPYLEAGRTIDAHFAGLAGTLATQDNRGRVIGGPLAAVLGMIDAYQREQEAKAAAERRRLEEEARRQREAAEAAAKAQREAEERERRAAEEAARKVREAEDAARRANDRAAMEQAERERAALAADQERREAAAREARLQAEIDDRRRREAAEALERQAAATKAGPIDSGYGTKASRRTVPVGKIVDLKKAVAHAFKVDRAGIEEAVQKIVDRQLRAKVREFPGVEISETETTVIR